MEAVAEPAGGQLWPVGVVQARLSIGRTEAFKLITSGRLRSVRIGKRRLVSEASLCEFIASIDRADRAGGVDA